jgi:hypothetical protein
MTDALNIALDRFDVPPLSAGLADRIMAVATTPASAPFAAPRRDRRGMWRRGRQVLLGTMAVGLLSAGAIASGLLGRVGIEVPVLTAMLAPKPKPVLKPVHLAPKPAPVRAAEIAPPPAALIDPTPPGLLPRPLLPAERMALREERRERREAFAAEHPIAAAVIRERVRERLQRRALERRQALMTPGIDPSLPGARSLDLADRIALARAARRDGLVAEKMIDRRIQAREAKLAERQGANVPAPTGQPTGPAAPIIQAHPAPFPQRLQQTPEARAARRERLQQMTPEQRGLLRERMQQRRALRLGRQRPLQGQ